MIPIIYESNETNFDSNGLGRLYDCISCVTTEERNGIYECDFSYPLNAPGYDLIQLGNIIGVTHDESGDVQPFDIVSYSRPIDGVVTFHAVHISYRQSKMVSYGTAVYGPDTAFDILKHVCFSGNESGNPFTYVTDIEAAVVDCAAFDGTPRTVRSLLGGVEGSILDTYGGEYEWDKWTVTLHKERGVQRNFTIRYGVNMVDFRDETDCSEAYNACIPYWKDSSTGEVVIGEETFSYKEVIGAGNKCIPLDLSDKFEERPLTQDVDIMAMSIMRNGQANLPSQNIKVDFVRLQDEAGFDELDSLLQCKLCDSIKVVFPSYNMSAYFKIVKTTWNVLLDRYDEMELGNLSTTLAEALGLDDSLDSNASANGGIEYFTLPNTLGFSVWNGYGFRDKATGTVRIYITAYNATQISGTRITTVPSDCLPTVTQLIAGVVGLDVNSIFLGQCRIDSTTGDITNTASSVTRQVMVSAEYVYQ